MKRIILTAAVSLMAVCCVPFGIEAEFLESQEISLTWKGETQVSYNPEECQLGYHSGRNEYRVYDDRLSDWFTVRCSEMPSDEGQTLTADVSWTGSRSTKAFNGLQFTVSKTDDDGRIWLWNASDRIGIVIRNQYN